MKKMSRDASGVLVLVAMTVVSLPAPARASTEWESCAYQAMVSCNGQPDSDACQKVYRSMCTDQYGLEH